MILYFLFYLTPRDRLGDPILNEIYVSFNSIVDLTYACVPLSFFTIYLPISIYPVSYHISTSSLGKRLTKISLYVRSTGQAAGLSTILYCAIDRAKNVCTPHTTARPAAALSSLHQRPTDGATQIGCIMH